MVQIPFGVVAIGLKGLMLVGVMPHLRAVGILFQEVTQERERVWRGWAIHPRLVPPQGLEARGQPLRGRRKVPEALLQASMQARVKGRTRLKGVLERVARHRRRGHMMQRLCRVIPIREDVASPPSHLPL